MEKPPLTRGLDARRADWGRDTTPQSIIYSIFDSSPDKGELFCVIQRIKEL